MTRYVLLATALLWFVACSPEAPAPATPAETVQEVEGPVTPDEAPLVALTPVELNNTYRDLLGFPSELSAWPAAPPIAEQFKGSENETVGIFGAAVITPPAWPRVFPAEAGVDGFEGIAAGQEPSPASVEALQKAATHFAIYALVSPIFVDCGEADPVDDAGAVDDANGVYWDDVATVLGSGCAGCHTGNSSGGTNFASVYEDNLKPSTVCEGKLVGECVLERIDDGTMPPEGAKGSVSAEGRALIEAWINAGMPRGGAIPGTWSGLSEAAKASCGPSSVRRFAQRAWRRPLEDDERTRLQALWEQTLAAGSPDEAVVLTVAAILQAPAFVYRIENGDASRAQAAAVPFSDYEMASRLSYFLWDSMPDQTLFAAAAAGELRTAEQVEAQARRMLDDERAREMVVHFHDQWLETDRVRGISPARRVYGPTFGISPAPPLDTTGDQDWPAILGPIRHSLAVETQLFVERTIFDGGGTLKALLTDNHGYMSAVSQPIYGEGAKALPGPTVTTSFGIIVASQPNTSQLKLYPAEFPADERAGVLTLPSVLALGSYAVHPAPILRGKRILERLVCQELGTPPPSADAAAPPDTELAESTNRERTEIATSPPECAGCHITLNPPGFAFESYDALGRHRTEDNGFPVDTSGSFSVIGGETFTFDGAVDLAHQLAESARVHDCYTMRWTSYALGLHLHDDDPGLSELMEGFRANDRIRELLVSIAVSDIFRYRPQEVSP